MDQFESLREIWLSEKAGILPDSRKIQRTVAKYHAAKKRIIYLLIVLLILCFVVMALIVAFTNAHLWTTIFGEVLIIGGFILTLVLKLKALKKANQNEMKSNQEFLKDLHKSTSGKMKPNYLQLLAFFALGIGYGLFIYENVLDDRSVMVWSYLGILVFLVLMYTLFRPFAQRVSRKKSRKLLENIEQLTSQIV